MEMRLKPGPKPVGETPPQKACTGCGELKYLEQFPPRKDRPSGRQSRCRKCKSEWRKSESAKASNLRWYYQHKDRHLERARANWMRRKYNITPSEYDAMVAAQKGVCKICKKPDTRRYKRLAIDHCHETGRIRGLLCHPCNQALGVLGDSAASIQKVLDYLKE